MTDDKTATPEWVRWTTIWPDPDYWGDGYDPAYYDAVLAALERMGFEVHTVFHEGTTSDTTVLTRGRDGNFDPHEEFDWFSCWCGMESGHADADAVYRALKVPSVGCSALSSSVSHDGRERKGAGPPGGAGAGGFAARTPGC